MKKFEMKLLNELCDINIGKTPARANADYWEGSHNWLAISDLKSKYILNAKEQITDKALEECNMKLIPKNTVVMSFKLSLGKLGILNEAMYSNEAIASFLIKNSADLLPEYLYYALKTVDLYKYSDKAAKGITLNKKKLNLIEIPYTDLSNQTRIVKVLELAEQLLEKRQSQIVALDELTRSIFLEMFGDPQSENNKYIKKPLSDFGEIITGNTPSRKVEEYYGNHIEWIKSGNINTPHHFLTKAEEYLSEKGMEKGRVVPENSILVTCIAGSKDCIGNAAITDRKVAFNQQINAIIPKRNPYFLYTQFLVGKKLVQSASTDGMKGLVSKGAFQKVEFISPPDDLQDEFGEKFLAIQNQKQTLLKSLNNIENLYNALLQKAFNGELFRDRVLL